MKSILFIILVLGVFSSADINLKFKSVLSGQQALTKAVVREMYFNHFISDRPKSTFRFNIFERNLQETIAHNLGNNSWEKGINQFSDMTWPEFKAMHLMAPQNCSATKP